ncbi:hypothetical protein D3C86_2025560 [compost metagenome]
MYEKFNSTKAKFLETSKVVSNDCEQSNFFNIKFLETSRVVMSLKPLYGIFKDSSAVNAEIPVKSVIL